MILCRTNSTKFVWRQSLYKHGVLNYSPSSNNAPDGKWQCTAMILPMLLLSLRFHQTSTEIVHLFYGRKLYKNSVYSKMAHIEYDWRFIVSQSNFMNVVFNKYPSCKDKNVFNITKYMEAYDLVHERRN